MGTIALESPLDTAVCVLDYRLSCTTDNAMHTIYEYQISLLQYKIEKTHKKVAVVSSPVSVSPNKYTSLVVEDVDTQYTMDCADTTTSFVSPSVFNSTVPSMGVSKVARHQTLKGVCLIPVYLLMDKSLLLWHLVIQKVPPMIWKLVSWLNQEEPSQWNMRFRSWSEFKGQLILLRSKHC